MKSFDFDSAIGVYKSMRASRDDIDGIGRIHQQESLIRTKLNIELYLD
jgi:hypothetical protein